MESTPSAQPTFTLMGLRLPIRATLAVVISTLLLIFDYYYDFAARILPTPDFPDRVRHAAYDHFVMYGLIPLLVIVLVFRKRPADYGLRLGDWRAGLRWVGISWAAIAITLLIFGQSPEVVAYYQRYYADPLDTLFTAVVELIGWEFFFRGFLLFALVEAVGPMAVVLQAVPFALAHNGKPALETISTIFSGVFFGWVSWRTGSFLYAFLIHLFISTFIVFVVIVLA